MTSCVRSLAESTLSPLTGHDPPGHATLCSAMRKMQKGKKKLRTSARYCCYDYSKRFQPEETRKLSVKPLALNFGTKTTERRKMESLDTCSSTKKENSAKESQLTLYLLQVSMVDSSAPPSHREIAFAAALPEATDANLPLLPEPGPDFLLSPWLINLPLPTEEEKIAQLCCSTTHASGGKPPSALNATAHHNASTVR